jgi:arylsulfatase A-like enzyme
MNANNTIPNTRWTSPWLSSLAISLITSLIIGFSDIITSILYTPRFHSLIYLFPPLAITFVFFFLLQLLIFLPLGFLATRLGARPFRWFAVFSVFLGMFFIIGATADLFAFTLNPERILKALLVFLAASFAAVSFLMVIREHLNKDKFRQRLVSFGLSLPFVFAELMCCSWYYIYNQVQLFSFQFIILAAILLLMTTFTIWIFLLVGSKPTKAAMVTVLGVMVVAGYFIQPTSPLSAPFKVKSLEESSPKYVILITIDSLRADAVSIYNPSHTMTPHIDALARESVLFQHAVTSSSWTLPAVASLMTGMAPAVHQANRYNQEVSTRLPTIADQFRNAGYYTAAIGLNPNLLKRTDVSKGFIYYDFYPKFSYGRSIGAKIRKHLNHYIPDEKLTDVHSGDLQIDYTSFLSTDRLTDLSMQWMAKNLQKPFLFWLHYFDPHVPYAPPQHYLKGKKPEPSIGVNFDRPDDLLTGAEVPTKKEQKWIQELYNGEVRYVDDNVGRLIASLKQMGIYDDALIILTSDHGEEFWEHNGYYHGHTLYNELLHVPLLIKLPGSSTARRVDGNTVVSLEQIMPTLLDYCKIKLPRPNLYSPSLLPLIKENPESYISQPVHSSTLRYGQEKDAIYFGGLKYIHSHVSLDKELYNLAGDSQEKHSLLQQFPDKITEAVELLKQKMQSYKKIIKLFNIEEFDKNKKNKTRGRIDNLRTLGYF